MAIAKAIMDQIKPGATVRVFESVKEGDKERSMRFEGLVLARKHGSEPGASFTVRATVAGVGVEKTFPIFSPAISKVDILSAPHKVKRSKLYYIRDLSRKAIRQKTRKAEQVTDLPVSLAVSGAAKGGQAGGSAPTPKEAPKDEKK